MERILVNAIYKDGKLRREDLPVHPKGNPGPTSHPSWEYEIKGDTLHVSPSVRIRTTKPSETHPDRMDPVELFHSDGAWSVKFKEFIPGEYVQASDLFRELNP